MGQVVSGGQQQVRENVLDRGFLFSALPPPTSAFTFDLVARHFLAND